MAVSSAEYGAMVVSCAEYGAMVARSAAYGATVVSAAAAAPGQWKNWWWVCVAGEIVFIPLILLMAGRWSPRKAREDAEEHDRLVQQEMAKLEV